MLPGTLSSQKIRSKWKTVCAEWLNFCHRFADQLERGQLVNTNAWERKWWVEYLTRPVSETSPPPLHRHPARCFRLPRFEVVRLFLRRADPDARIFSAPSR